MKSCYEKAFESTINKINKCGNNFLFVVLADSHLDISVKDSCDNIRNLCESAPVSCVLHLGDLMCDGFPRDTINRLLKKEIDMFLASSPNGHFLPVRGNHDGYRNPITSSGVIRSSEDWHNLTEHIDSLPHVSRVDGSPYYYIDYPEKKIRFIALESFFRDEENRAKCGYDDKQLEWFRSDALNLGEEWTVIAFSHDSPFKDFSDKFAEDDSIYNGNTMLGAIRSGVKTRGFKFAAWLVGHYHGDYIFNADGINIVLVASQTAYTPSLWNMPKGGSFPKRTIEDCWDAVCVDSEKRVLRFFRFGAGADREISY